VGVIHRATMHDLKPKTTYYYRVGNGDFSWSDIYSFVTSSSDLSSVTYAVIADMAYDEQSDYTVSSVAKLVQQQAVQAVIHSGDISYADG
jgi:phosphodiesterase/alkaline phosphatase D-like protein